MSYALLLSELSREIGIDTEALLRTEELIIDDRTISFLLDGTNEDGSIVFFTTLGTPDKAQLARIAPTLLQANHLWAGTNGCTLGLQTRTGAVVLCGQLPITMVDASGMVAVLDTFVDTADFWQSFVAGLPMPESANTPFVDPAWFS